MNLNLKIPSSCNAITPKILQGFKNYRYNAIDSSPLSYYIFHPIWNRLVVHVPRTIAPNLLTFTGFLYSFCVFLLFAYFDPELRGAHESTIPRWVFLCSAFLHLSAYTLDCLDGKHARRTGLSTPLGELFDHGLDSWTTTLVACGMLSTFGTRTGLSLTPIRCLHIQMIALGVFSLTHLEKYITGVMYLPWAYDISQIACCLLYLVPGLFGTDVFSFSINLPIFGETCFINIAFFAVIAGSLFGVPMSIYNMWSYARLRNDGNTQGVKLCLAALPFLAFNVFVYSYVYIAPHVFENNIRWFIYFVGIIVSNIICRLIVCQMSNSTADVWNGYLNTMLLTFLSILCFPNFGKQILWISALLHTLTHVYYGVTVVRSLANFYGIDVFGTERKPRIDVKTKLVLPRESFE